jgi:hypothetical protein
MKIHIITGYRALWHSWNWTFTVVVSSRHSIPTASINNAKVFLTNTSPARCHIHTVNRLPNRGDYGKALLEQ